MLLVAILFTQVAAPARHLRARTVSHRRRPPHGLCSDRHGLRHAFVRADSHSAIGASRRSFMTDTKTHPYVTHLDIKFPPLDLIDVEALAKSVTDRWYNQTLCKVNDSVIRLGVMQGEYHWHKHDNDDEFF